MLLEFKLTLNFGVVTSQVCKLTNQYELTVFNRTYNTRTNQLYVATRWILILLFLLLLTVGDNDFLSGALSLLA